MRDRPRAHTHAHAHAAGKWKTSMRKDGVDAWSPWNNPLASRAMFLFFFFAPFGFDFGLIGG